MNFPPLKSGNLLPAIFWIAVITGTALFLQNISDKKQFEFENPGADLFGGTDWVQWEDSAKGIAAVAVHPVITGNTHLKNTHIRKGDILRRIDYREIFEAETVKELVKRAPPGKVFIYQLERILPGAFEPETVSIFVRNSARPRMTFIENIFLWRAGTWIFAAGAFLALMSLLILLPILAVSIRNSWPVLFVLVATVLVFTLQFFRQLYCLITPELASPGFEQSYLSSFYLLLLIIGPVLLASKFSGMMRIIALGGLIPAIALGIFTAVKLRSGQFWLYEEPISSAVFSFFYLCLALALIRSLSLSWKGKSPADKVFESGALLLALVFIVYYGGSMAGSLSVPKPGETLLFFALAGTLLPAASLAAGELKFGKVSLVVTQSIVYLLVTVTAIVLYFFIHQSFTYFSIAFRYQVFFEIAFLVLAFFLLRNLYRKYADRFRKYFVLKQQKKIEILNSFIATIPQHTSSEKLIRDLQSHLSAYFEADLVGIPFLSDESTTIPGISREDLLLIRETFSNTPGCWAKNKQLSSVSLDSGMEKKFIGAGIFQVHLIPVRENHFGFIFLGKKKRGVYNLADVENISRIIQQTRLTLDVLDMMEREKVLIQKNYEANLTALRSQINPHFLFNTLNTISSLTHDSPDDAETAIEKLAFIFRYTLRQSAMDFVTVRDELSLVRTYLDIEQLRFGDRLKITYEVEESVLDKPIPAFVIQTIAENAIKHGIAPLISGGEIQIRIRAFPGHILCEITDNGPGINLSRITASTGLNNVLTRLEKIYSDRNLCYFENTGKGTLVRIKIPEQNEQKTESADS